MVHNALYIGVKLTWDLSIPEKEMNFDIHVTPDVWQGFTSADRSYEVFPAHSHAYIFKSELGKK